MSARNVTRILFTASVDRRIIVEILVTCRPVINLVFVKDRQFATFEAASLQRGIYNPRGGDYRMN